MRVLWHNLKTKAIRNFPGSAGLNLPCAQSGEKMLNSRSRDGAGGARNRPRGPSPEERCRLRFQYNETSRDLRETCHGLVDEEGVRTPNHITAVRGGKSTAYQELNRRANRMAYHSRDEGVAPDAHEFIASELPTVIGLPDISKADTPYIPNGPASRTLSPLSWGLWDPLPPLAVQYVDCCVATGVAAGTGSGAKPSHGRNKCQNCLRPMGHH